MDAREAHEWLVNRLPDAEEMRREALDAGIERTPMTDLQWRKLKTLQSCRMLPGSYDKRFVHDLVNAPYDYPMTEKQSRYLELLWQRYRKQHGDQLAEPRWIYDLQGAELAARHCHETYRQSEIGWWNAADDLSLDISVTNPWYREYWGVAHYDLPQPDACPACYQPVTAIIHSYEFLWQLEEQHGQIVDTVKEYWEYAACPFCGATEYRVTRNTVKVRMVRDGE